MSHSELFDHHPRVHKSRLNVLPSHEDTHPSYQAVDLGRFPSWLHRKLPAGSGIVSTGDVIGGNRLHTVCEEARCPNLFECWSQKTATFLALGKECTRNCGFCAIDFNASPKPLEQDEPDRIAASVRALDLKHVVITMVARDDLPDGGASHLKLIVEAIRKANPRTTIELLTFDFGGNTSAWDTVLSSKPAVFNYNIETVRTLTPRVRHKATYERTLQFLRYARKKYSPEEMAVKSGLMVGLGETSEQVYETLIDLKSVGCNIVTIGQYLQPSPQKLRVKAFITPDQFRQYTEFGQSIGIQYVYAGPFVRSSYHAAEVMENIPGPLSG